MNYRLYAFVANHYLSPLQCGLQTAHVVSDLSVKYVAPTHPADVFYDWARDDKTIIICGAGNHQGVVDCFHELQRVADPLGLPYAIFHEDEQSMNGMATACGVIVPEKYYNVQFFDAKLMDDGRNDTYWQDAYWEHGLPDLKMKRFPVTHPEGQFISHIKKYRLA